MGNIPIDNNNPGDLKMDGHIQKFDDPLQGKAALYNDLTAKMTGKSTTGLTPQSSLTDFSKVYAPAADDNDPIQYSANLANQLKVSPDTQIGTLMPRIDDFASAVAHNEGYQDTAQPAQNTTQSTPKDYWNDVPAGAPASWKTLDTAGGILGTIATLGLTGIPELLGLGATGGADTAIGEVASTGGKSLLSKIGSMIGISSAGDVAIEAAKGLLNKGITNQPSISTSSSKSSVGFPSDIEQSTQTSQTALQSILQGMNQTAGGSVKMQSPDYQSGAQAAATYSGLVPSIDSNNRYDSSKVEKRKNELVSSLDEGVGAALEHEGSAAKMTSFHHAAQRSNTKYSPTYEQPQSSKHVQDISNSYMQRYADKKGNISLANLHKIKKETGHFYDHNDSAKTNAMKAINAAAKETILNHTKHKELYSKALAEEKKIIYAGKIAKHLNGKKAPENKSKLRGVLHTGSKIVATYIGDKIGGPIGAVLGAMVGEHLSKAIDKKHGKTIFETKGMKQALDTLKSRSPMMYQKLQEELKKAGIHQEGAEIAIPLEYLKKRDIRLNKELKKGDKIMKINKQKSSQLTK